MGHLMPLDNVQSYDLFWDRAVWELKFLLWPEKCELTGKRLWLRFAYKGTAVWSGPGDPAYEVRYRDKIEHLMWILKGN